VNYVLITPARNEEAFLELTIRAVMAQSVRPLRYVIVSDGSTDRTDEIAAKYAAREPWIQLLRMPPRERRDFGGKVAAFEAGRAQMADLAYDAIGSLDADITFDAEYFAFLLKKLEGNPRLGLVGTPFDEGAGTYDYRFSSVEHVSGACQLFRRACYEQIGGYMPLKGGGIDVVAVLSARMHGWETRTFLEKTSVHHRPMGSANDHAKFLAQFNLGQRAYRLGFHPLWQVGRSVYQMTRRPYVVGGGALLLGYGWAMLRRVPRPIPAELVAFQRRDQMKRLRTLTAARLGRPQARRAPGAARGKQ
jgi:glycosyltransferase involved in cell wall biosynthesis